MKLPLKILEKKEQIEYFLALILSDEKVISVIFEKHKDTIKYIASDEEYFKDTIENANEEEFLDVLDKVITTAETSLPENIETHKTLFGLKDSWIENDKIKKEYLDKLKNASDELALEPIGFLAFSESLINLIQKEEGAPVTAVLINVGKKYLTIHWVRGGKIIETKTSEIHESSSYTADALLRHFQTAGNLPTKIVLFDSDEDELTQEFISHKWSKSLPFLHLPQIASLPADAAVKAMLLGASTQMNTNLVYDYSKNLEDEVQIEKKDKNEDSFQKEDEIVDKKEINETFEPNYNSLDTFEENDDEKHIDVNETSTKLFGFLEDADITKKAPPLSPKPDIKIPDEITKAAIQEIPEEIKVDEESKTPLAVNASFVNEKIKLFLSKILRFFTKNKVNKSLLTSFKSKNKLLLIIPLVVFLSLLSILYLYLFKTTAQIDVFVNPKQEQKEASITFSSSTDIPNKTLMFNTISVSENGTASVNTTGKKFVGDKAKGSVTIFNNRGSSVNLPVGTKITSSNNLDFITDSAVSVASASGDIFSGTKPGTANINITASDIGQDFNLPSGTKFSIGNSSDVAAKNDSAFSGGTKKSITIVSSDDLDKLLTELPKSLESKARKDLESKIVDGKTIIPQFISVDVTDKTFDKKEGQEASKVTLTGTVSFEAISYVNQDMADFANTLFSSQEQIIPSDLEIQASNMKLQKNQDVTAKLRIKANLMPKIDIESLRRQIVGYSRQKATNALINLPQAQEVNIDFNPNIPLLPKNLPGDYKKIFINITSK